MTNNKDHPIDREALARTKKIAEEIKFCMMTSATPEGHLISRPMTALEIDDEGCFWFFASEESEQTISIDREDSVNLAFALPSESKYLAVTGSATVVKDRAKIDALWNPWAAAWFPDGKDDPLLCLIRVHAQTAEYWEGPGKLVQIFGIAKAILTHKRYDTGGEHAKLI